MTHVSHSSSVDFLSFTQTLTIYSSLAGWRGWYIDVRERQRRWFSETYLFFSPVNVGITYGMPIYITDDQERKVFAGVLAVDMVLEDISDFLVSAFGQTEYIVGIFEDREPHLMIGVNTGTRLVGDFLIEDESQKCSVEQVANGECTLIHLTIEGFVSTEQDMILLKAHEEFQKIGYDEDKVVTLKIADEKEGFRAYLATFLVYEKVGANLKWRIMVVVPLQRSTEDSITAGEGLFSIICIIGVLGLVCCSSLSALLYRNRKEEAVQFADFYFTNAFIVGCAILNLSTLTLLGENTDR